MRRTGPRFVPQLEILEDRTLLSTFFWTGADKNGLWSDSKNWFDQATGKVAARAPGMLKAQTEDIAEFDNSKVTAALRSVTVDKTVRYLDKLEVNDNYGVANTTAITIGANLYTNTMSYQSDRPILTGSGKLVLRNGESFWAVGVMKGAFMVVGPNATLNIIGGGNLRNEVTLQGDSALINQGTVNLENATIMVGGSSFIRNAARYELENQGGGKIVRVKVPAIFQMDGTANVERVFADGEFQKGFFVNQGDVLASPGTALIDVKFIDSGTVKLRSSPLPGGQPGRLTFDDGGIFDDGSVFTALGTDKANVFFSGPNRIYLMENNTFEGVFVTYTLNAIADVHFA